MQDKSDFGKAAALNVVSMVAGYGEVPIVQDVSIKVLPGQIVGVVGPNGAGKSTCLKAIVGIIPKMGGSVLFEGEDVTKVSTEGLVRKGMGYVPQLNDVFGPLSVLENLLMGGYLLGRKEVKLALSSVFEIFPRLEEMSDRSANKLSGGQRKMVALGRALMLRPRVLVLDEPTANLSPEMSEVVLHEQVPRLSAAGVGVLVVEQKADLLLSVANWSCVLVAGRIAVSGPTAELRQRSDFADLMLGGSGVASGNSSVSSSK